MAITDHDIGFLLCQRLLASEAVTALVETRIRPDTIDPNEKLPAIRYELITSDSWHHLGGSSAEARTRIQFDCYGALRVDAARVADAVRNCLDGFTGSLGSIWVSDCVLDNRFDRTDPPADGAKQWRKRRTLDFVVVHTEPKPTLS